MLYFYQPNIHKDQFFLDDDEYQHCVKVLRKKVGDEIGIMDGKGLLCEAVITEIDSKKCHFTVSMKKLLPPKKFSNHIAISPTKNIDRIEWLVEKACELGVDRISFIQTNNSERTKLRIDRLERKAVSALKQSKSGYLTQLDALIKFDEFLEFPSNANKMIAVVEPDLPYLATAIEPGEESILLIGPEGDFSPQETQKAVKLGFTKVSLGNNTLRTETAGIVAATIVNVSNTY